MNFVPEFLSLYLSIILRVVGSVSRHHLMGSPVSGLTVKVSDSPIAIPSSGVTSNTLPPYPPSVTTHSSKGLAGKKIMSMSRTARHEEFHLVHMPIGSWCGWPTKAGRLVDEPLTLATSIFVNVGFGLSTMRTGCSHKEFNAVNGVKMPSFSTSPSQVPLSVSQASHSLKATKHRPEPASQTQANTNENQQLNSRIIIIIITSRVPGGLRPRPDGCFHVLADPLHRSRHGR